MCNRSGERRVAILLAQRRVDLLGKSPQRDVSVRIHDAEPNLRVGQAGRVDEANREDHVGVLGIGDQLIASPLLHALVELVVGSLRASAVSGGKGAYVSQLERDECLL